MSLLRELPGPAQPGITIISAEQTSASPTSATVVNFQIVRILRSRVDLQQQLVARQHRAPETRLVDAREVELRILVRVDAGRDETQDARRLRQCFEDDHARHDRAAREVPREELLVRSDVLQCDERFRPRRIRGRGRRGASDNDAATAASPRRCRIRPCRYPWFCFIPLQSNNFSRRRRSRPQLRRAVPPAPRPARACGPCGPARPACGNARCCGGSARPRRRAPAPRRDRVS